MFFMELDELLVVGYIGYFFFFWIRFFVVLIKVGGDFIFIVVSFF